MLKISWPHTEALHEADGLRFWAGDGIVRLVGSVVVGDTHALLLEACEPGTSLTDTVAEEPAGDEVVAGLLRRLWREPPDCHPFRPLQAMCDEWADAFEAGYARTPPPRRIDPGIARAGIALFRDLPASASRAVLTYLVLEHMLNCPHRLASDPITFVRRLAELAGLDRDRLRLWLFARCVRAPRPVIMKHPGGYGTEESS